MARAPQQRKQIQRAQQRAQRVPRQLEREPRQCERRHVQRVAAQGRRNVSRARRAGRRRPSPLSCDLILAKQDNAPHLAAALTRAATLVARPRIALAALTPLRGGSERVFPSP